MSAVRFETFASLRSSVGAHLGFSDWHTVTQADIDRFAEAINDHQWIHVDAARASAGPFGSTIAHGWLTLAIGTTLMSEVVSIGRARLSINYGANRVRFPAAVPSGARVRAGVELLSAVEEGDDCRVGYRLTVELAGSGKPACVAETLAVYRWR